MERPITPPSSAAKSTPDTSSAAAPVSALRPTVALNATVAPLLQNAVAGLHLTNGTAEYKASLVALRQTDGAPALLAQSYHAAPDHEYMQRWSLTTVLADLHHPDALAPLHAIAIAPLPTVKGEDAPHVLAEETMIRTAAIEGIARQAAKSPDAKALLLQSVQSPVFSVRRAAAQAYLAQGGARADLEKVLPSDQRFLLDIRSVSAAQLPVTPMPNAAPRNPAREILAPGTPGAPAHPAATDAPRSK